MSIDQSLTKTHHSASHEGSHTEHASHRPLSDYPMQLFDEVRAMVRFSFSRGLAVPPDVAATVAEAVHMLPSALNSDTIKSMAHCHRTLSAIVAPAYPGTILLLDQESGLSSSRPFLGPVPLIRRLQLVAFFSLLALIITSLSPDVNGDPAHFNLLKSDGMVLFLNELFLLSAASLGASFANLFKAHGYVRNATFDPNLEASYWIRFASGVIAGTILAMLLPVWLIDPQSFTAGQGAFASGLGAPALAMIGGFSADLVYRVLSRITEALESLVRGSLSDHIATRELEGRARLKEKQLSDKLALVSSIADLQHKLSEGSDPAMIREELRKLQSRLLDSHE